MFTIKTINDLVSHYNNSQIPRLNQNLDIFHLITVQDINDEIICKKYNPDKNHITNYGLFIENEQIFCIHNEIEEIMILCPTSHFSCFGGECEIEAFIKVNVYQNHEFFKSFQQKIYPIWKMDGKIIKNKNIQIEKNVTYQSKEFILECSFGYNQKIYHQSLKLIQDANIANKYIDSKIVESQIKFTLNNYQIGSEGDNVEANVKMYYQDEKIYKDCFNQIIKTELSPVLIKDITDLCTFSCDSNIVINKNILCVPKQSVNHPSKKYKVYCTYGSKTYCQEIIQDQGDVLSIKKTLCFEDLTNIKTIELNSNLSHTISFRLISETVEFLNGYEHNKVINNNYTIINNCDWVNYSVTVDNLLQLDIKTNPLFEKRMCNIKIFNEEIELNIFIYQSANFLVKNEYKIIMDEFPVINQITYKTFNFKVNILNQLIYNDGQIITVDQLNEDDELIVVCDNNTIKKKNDIYYISDYIHDIYIDQLLPINILIYNKKKNQYVYSIQKQLKYIYDHSLLKNIEINVIVQHETQQDIFSYNSSQLDIIDENGHTIKKELSNFWLNPVMNSDIILSCVIQLTIGENYRFKIDSLEYNNGVTKPLDEVYLIEKDDIGIDLIINFKS